ncbi:heterogeneous nuclear ribonucleoprotein C-like isoform X4 [Gouania willdenowi]|uniref:heterogeneous nuclear ribonucleoprotein C-like isoform X4 n=1 Tax=Gouania willdenowi TaxID=441366 RepID=UPI001055F1B5|nr:heterogeneous nuclear ribonucleoprotein C-like isoform X4 [Gouania willdenowi]
MDHSPTTSSLMASNVTNRTDFRSLNSRVFIDINLAGEPKPHRSKTTKRSAGDMYSSSSFDLDYDFQRDYYDRLYSYPSRVPAPPPPLSRAVIPTKRPRVSLSGGGSGSRRTKSSFSSSKSSQRNSSSRPMKADELQTIKRELSQIKSKVDDLLESLERMEKDHGKKSVKSIKMEPGEVTTPPHSSNKEDDESKNDQENQDINDTEEEEQDEGYLLEEEEVKSQQRDEDEEEEEGEHVEDDDGQSVNGDEGS